MSNQVIELKHEGRQDSWTSVRIETSLAETLDDFIQKCTKYGARKYTSRSNAAQAAILKLLESEVYVEEEKEEARKKAQ
jgi:Arc/MetJ-type ribon-helix-helix transcriptional regulator